MDILDGNAIIFASFYNFFNTLIYFYEITGALSAAFYKKIP
jgi:hypothetical protein